MDRATDLRERLQAALGAQYAFERELGGGGMSRVFVVRDVRLDRRVVVKVLHPDLAAGLSAARFQREIRIAARLQHPHLVPVHFAGEVDELPYYTMPFVEGESLRERLRREGALPIPDVLRLTLELADALAYAHERGVVHRDLKPENVLLSGGHAFIVDFGVAKALASASRGELRATSLVTTTAVGLAIGTPAYMAPEQASADPGTDHRADLYALGALTYELLVGEPPFCGRPTLHALVAAHLTEPAPPVAERRPDTPPALAALVAHLLAKRPDDRPASAREIMTALERLIALMTADSMPITTVLPRPEPWWRRRAVLTAAALAALAAIGVGTCLGARPPHLDGGAADREPPPQIGTRH